MLQIIFKIQLTLLWSAPNFKKINPKKPVTFQIILLTDKQMAVKTEPLPKMEVK